MIVCLEDCICYVLLGYWHWKAGKWSDVHSLGSQLLDVYRYEKG